MTATVAARVAATASVAVALLLGGCGGGTPARPEDGALRLDLDAGAGAMALRRYDEAARDYAGAYRRALVLDNADALATASINEAIAQEDGNDANGALATAARARADLALRGMRTPPELGVAAAAALLRLDQPAAAAEAAAAAAAGTADPAVAERAAFLDGLAADRLGDRSALAAALARMPPTRRGESAMVVADRAELQARLAFDAGDRPPALQAAVAAIGARRMALDERGLRRALALAAAIAPGTGFATELRQSLAAERADGGGAR